MNDNFSKFYIIINEDNLNNIKHQDPIFQKISNNLVSLLTWFKKENAEFFLNKKTKENKNVKFIIQKKDYKYFLDLQKDFKKRKLDLSIKILDK